MKTIKISYFAVLRETANKQNEEYQTNANTLTELYRELAERYAFPLKASEISVAVNNAYVSMNDTFNQDDHVVFIPPIAGG